MGTVATIAGIVVGIIVVVIVLAAAGFFRDWSH